MGSSLGLFHLWGKQKGTENEKYKRETEDKQKIDKNVFLQMEAFEEIFWFLKIMAYFKMQINNFKIQMDRDEDNNN